MLHRMGIFSHDVCDVGGNPNNILIRMPNWIGDAVMATPIVADLRSAFPHAHITAMGRGGVCEMLAYDPNIDELLYCGTLRYLKEKKQRKDLLRQLSRRKYDLGLLLPGSFSSAWWMWRGKVRRRIGYRGNGRSYFLTDRVLLPPDVQKQHLVITYKMLLGALNLPISDTQPRVYVLPQELDWARQRLGISHIPLSCPIVTIHPGAAYGSAKCWLPERFRQVTKQLLQKGPIHILYVGDQKAVPLVEEICRDLPPCVINLAGQTSIRELASLIQISSVILTNDSGPMHLAAALGTPLVALFGSTNPNVTGPRPTGTVIYKHPACSPCYKRVCPIDFRCMKQITTDEVYEAILSHLHTK